MPSTHEKVTSEPVGNDACMGVGGSAALVREALAVIGGRWTLEIVFRLFETPTLRFSELQHRLANVSHKMLAQRLRELETEGVVRRVAFPQVPPRVEYSLTERGMALRPMLRALRDWRSLTLDEAPVDPR